MVKTLIKIAVALVVIHAAFRVGNAFWNYYRYEDALLQLAQFGERTTEKQLCDQAMTAAGEYGVPIEASNLSVRKGRNLPYNCDTGPGATPGDGGAVAFSQLSIDGFYVERLQLLPGYFYPWEFKPSASARLRF
jgi:hypothetical protein